MSSSFGRGIERPPRWLEDQSVDCGPCDFPRTPSIVFGSDPASREPARVSRSRWRHKTAVCRSPPARERGFFLPKRERRAARERHVSALSRFSERYFSNPQNAAGKDDGGTIVHGSIDRSHTPPGGRIRNRHVTTPTTKMNSEPNARVVGKLGAGSERNTNDGGK